MAIYNLSANFKEFGKELAEFDTKYPQLVWQWPYFWDSIPTNYFSHMIGLRKEIVRKIQIQFRVPSIAPIVINHEFLLTVAIRNYPLGFGDFKNVAIKLTNSPYATVISSPSVHIGALADGNVARTTFRMKAIQAIFPDTSTAIEDITDIYVTGEFDFSKFGAFTKIMRNVYEDVHPDYGH